MKSISAIQKKTCKTHDIQITITNYKTQYKQNHIQSLTNEN